MKHKFRILGNEEGDLPIDAEKLLVIAPPEAGQEYFF